MTVTVSALIFTFLTVIVILIQAGLAVGMPWGSASMGGKYPDKYPHAEITNYFMISAKGGTGGGAFRKMYGDFLIEASELAKQSDLKQCGKRFFHIADMWDAIATELMELYHTGKDAILERVSPMLIDIAEKEGTEFKQLKLIISR